MDDDVRVLELLDLKAEAGEEEAVTRRERRRKPLLDGAELAAVAETHGKQWLLDDHSGIQAVLLGDGGVGDAPHSAGLGNEAAEAVIGFKRVAPGCDEAQHLIEGLLDRKSVV